MYACMYVCMYIIYIYRVDPVIWRQAREAYMLNTRSDHKSTVFYSYFAWFMNTVPLNMYRVPVIDRVCQAEYVIRIRVAAPQEYVNTYSTCRGSGPTRSRRGPGQADAAWPLHDIAINHIVWCMTYKGRGR